jgi:hypothetical protein
MKGERGFAYVMVLILLALGALMIVPSLQLIDTVLRGRAIYAPNIMNDYTAGSAIEYGMWRVKWEPGFAETLPIGSESTPFNITLNGVQATVTIVAQATQGGLSGVGLAKDYQIIPTKTVFPSTAQPGNPETFTYTITMKRLEPSDAAFNPLESVLDALDLGFTYVPNSSKLDGVPFNDDDLTILQEPVKLKEQQREFEFDSEADAMVDEANPNQNYGTSVGMDVRSQDGNRNRRSFVWFDVSWIESGATINKAELELCAGSQASGDSRTYEVHRVTSSWNETSIKWNNQPSVAGSPTDSTKAPKDPGKCIKWNVKADVQAWVDGTPNHGWRISDQNENSGTAYTTTFRTREDTTDPTKDPVLKKVQLDPGYWTIEWIFQPDLNFTYGQERTLSFQATATPEPNTRYCNIAEVRPEKNNTGMTATITVGTPSYSGCPGGGIIVTKTSDPLVVYPGVPTVVTYVISIINNDIGGFDKLDSIEDYLPPGYTYIAGSASAQWTNTAPFTPDSQVYGYSSDDNDFYGSPDGYNICDFEPEEKLEGGRWKLKWHKEVSNNGFNPTLDLCHDYPLPYGATYTQTFQALADVEQTGSYYNEVIVKLKDSERYGGDRGIDELDKTYTGPTGETVVPDFDLQSTTTITNLRSNAAVTATGTEIKSWHWKKHK